MPLDASLNVTEGRVVAEEARAIMASMGVRSIDELIAANLGVDDIARHIGVDSLGYLSLEGMLGAVPGGPDGFCHACFSGDYPTPPPSDLPSGDPSPDPDAGRTSPRP